MIADTRDAVGDKCAIAVRFAVEEFLGAEDLTHDGEGRDVITALADEPDLWDVNLSNWSNDSQTSRFSQEGFQEEFVSFVKPLTSKPVVGVGRYTSPDAMVRAIKKGIFDLIGAARPSIADPFLPAKIRDGRIDDIRECIGCNICTASDNTVAPMRCTQNPTIGEEWRKGWHPEIIPPLQKQQSVLIIGGGPTGLEAARAMAQRGAEGALAEATQEWGGRVTQECRLPGLAAWGRVRDWRLGQLRQASNAQLYLDSRLSAEDVLSFGIPHIAIATGARWRNDGVGRVHRDPLDYLAEGTTVGVNALLENGVAALANDGPVVVFDDDRYYMASVLAELIASSGRSVTFITPASIVAPWTEHTLEQIRVQRRLIEKGVEIIPLHQLAGRTNDTLNIACSYSGKIRTIDCATLVPVTSRLPNDQLWHDLVALKHQWMDHGLETVERIGDCLSPGIIATATHAGHGYLRSRGSQPMDADYDIYR